MQPLKAKTLFPETARILNVPEEVAALFLGEYYGEVRETLSQLKFPVVMLPGLGNFSVKHWALEKQLNKYTDYDKKMSISGPMRERALSECKLKLDQLTNMKNLYDQEQLRKQTIQDQRPYEPKPNSTPDMEEP